MKLIFLIISIAIFLDCVMICIVKCGKKKPVSDPYILLAILTAIVSFVMIVKILLSL